MHLTLLDDSGGAGLLTGGALIFLWILAIALGVFYIVCYWKVFTKAGKAGWLSIIPIVNLVVLLNIGGLSGWWLLVGLVPGVDVVFLAIFSLVVYWNLGKAFGRGVGFRLGLMFLHAIFIAILAFGDAQYVGPRPVVMTLPQQQPRYQ